MRKQKSKSIPKFRIRAATAEDAAAFRAIYAPVVEKTGISLELKAPSVAEMRARLKKYTKTHPWLVAEVQGEVAGYAYASPHRERLGYRWAVDVSAYVAESHRGRGIGKKLYARLFKILKVQNFTNAYAGIGLPNAASIALHESCGFRKIGHYTNVGFKLGRWQDVGWWELALATPAAAPLEPMASWKKIAAEI